MKNAEQIPSDEIYRLSRLVKGYGERFTLRVDRLSIRRGEILAVIGPSGSGKSTLLRLLNLLEAPSSGSIQFFGYEFGTQEGTPLALRRKVTTVFQQPMLLNRSVRANLAYGLKLRGEREVDRKVERSLDAIGLQDLANQPARMLSGGEAQRVALARAILLEPDVLLLDEPTANLDPFNVGLIEERVGRLRAERQTTIVLVTHNLFQARRLAERAILLMDGEIVHAGEIDEFFDRPANPAVEAFVTGDMVY